jgi:hypothetical protein
MRFFHSSYQSIPAGRKIFKRVLKDFEQAPIFCSPVNGQLRKGGPMNRMAKLQFQRLPPEAKRAALWRLAWSGLAIEQMAERTGCSVEQVRSMIDEESMQPSVPWQSAGRWAGGGQALPA